MMKIVVASLVGFVVYFVVASLIYGVLFNSFLPHPEETPQIMYMVTAGCLFTGILFAYILVYLGAGDTSSNAIRNGAILMGLLALTMHAFTYDCMKEWTWTHRIVDLLSSIVIGILMAWAIWFVNSKMSKKQD
jgi:divalent metal cation (Fe/Co/Zn/Cd) transporter